MLNTVLVLASSLASVLLVRYFFDVWKDYQQVRDLPGYRLLLNRSSVIGNFFKWRLPYIAIGQDHSIVSGFEDYITFGWDVVSSIGVYPRRISYIVADPMVIKEITGSRAKFPKPTEVYKSLSLFGNNIVTTEHDEWKKHRKVANPAFSEASNNRLVCEEAIRAMEVLFKDVWKNQDVVEVDDFSGVTVEVSLLVIGSAGFGRAVSRAENKKVLPGHEMSFHAAMEIVSTDAVIKAFIPDWVGLFSPRVRLADKAFNEFRLYLQEMVDARKVSGDLGKSDLLSLLVGASEDELDDGSRLNVEELVGNVFMFLFAGHETTAHTLAFTFGLLALHQKEQEKLYEHIKSVLPNGELPTPDKLHLLTHVLGVFYETLRLFPSVVIVPKMCAEDTTFVVGNYKGETRTMHAPKGSHVDLHVAGLHKNPRYWKDPDLFRPERFSEDWPRDAFIPFSNGSRSCIGRRFGETESIVFITMLMQRYKVEVLDEPQFRHETFAQREARVLKPKMGLTLTPARIPLVFKRR